jgi:hypothetical protein
MAGNLKRYIVLLKSTIEFKLNLISLKEFYAKASSDHLADRYYPSSSLGVRFGSSKRIG